MAVLIVLSFGLFLCVVVVKNEISFVIGFCVQRGGLLLGVEMLLFWLCGDVCKKKSFIMSSFLK